MSAEFARAYCSERLSLMVEDDSAGYLCPAHDKHEDCSAFPCSGEADIRGAVVPCVLNRPVLAAPLPTPASNGRRDG